MGKKLEIRLSEPYDSVDVTVDGNELTFCCKNDNVLINVSGDDIIVNSSGSVNNVNGSRCIINNGMSINKRKSPYETESSVSGGYSVREKHTSPAVTILFLERLSDDTREKAFSDMEFILNAAFKAYGIKDNKVSLNDKEIKGEKYLQYAKYLNYLEYLKTHADRTSAYRHAVIDINVTLEENYNVKMKY